MNCRAVTGKNIQLKEGRKGRGRRGERRVDSGEDYKRRRRRREEIEEE